MLSVHDIDREVPFYKEEPVAYRQSCARDTRAALRVRNLDAAVRFFPTGQPPVAGRRCADDPLVIPDASYF